MRKLLIIAAIIVIGILGYTIYAKVSYKEKSLVIVIPSYNNKDWYDQNLSSIFNQKYTNYRVVYVDDCSTDGTADLVAQKVAQEGQEHRFTLIRNKKRKGALANQYKAIHKYCNDDDILLLVDGDDWLQNDNVFTLINQAYQDPNVWMTYGQYEEFPGKKRGLSRNIPQHIILNNAYRRAPWMTSHLRTCYAWLFKKIKKEDLMHNGEFFKATGDLAFMFPMLEIAAGHWKFIPDILYVYNTATPLNDYKTKLQLQQYYHRIIRNMKPYEPLKEAWA